MDTLEHILRLYDRDLMRSAQNYNLDRPEERLRSVRELENLLLRIARYTKPPYFIEAGAKDASVSEKVRKHLPDTNLVAFEANPYTYEKFKDHKRMKECGIEYIHKALSRKVGSIEFSLQAEIDGVKRSKTSGDGSLRTPKLDDVTIETHTVKTISLDRYFKKFDTEGSFIWVDVEGATDQVLQGGNKLFADNIGIALIEIEDREIWEGQWLSSDVNKFMFDRGFTPCARDFQTRYQYNVMYVHERLINVDYVRYCIAMHASMAASAKFY